MAHPVASLVAMLLLGPKLPSCQGNSGVMLWFLGACPPELVLHCRLCHTKLWSPLGVGPPLLYWLYCALTMLAYYCNCYCGTGKLAGELGIPLADEARERFLMGGSDAETLSTAPSEEWGNGGESEPCLSLCKAGVCISVVACAWFCGLGITEGGCLVKPVLSHRLQTPGRQHACARPCVECAQPVSTYFSSHDF